MKKVYRKPTVRSQRVRIGVYGPYGAGPIQQLAPYFSQCCP